MRGGLIIVNLSPRPNYEKRWSCGCGKRCLMSVDRKTKYDMRYKIREAASVDIPHILKIMPRLAEFELPPRRTPEMFWSEDTKLLQTWGAGDAPHCFVHVADSAGDVVGVTIVTLGEEFFDHTPSAHLEVVCVAKSADSHGIGRALIANAELEAQKRGAGSLSLHVVANNKRARHVYQKIGFTEELVRCIKHFE